MYDELVAVLRRCGSLPCEGCPRKMCKGVLANMREAADAIEKLSMKLHGDEAAIAGMKREIERMVVAGKPRWIPVTERLPNDGDYVLAYIWSAICVMRVVFPREEIAPTM